MTQVHAERDHATWSASSTDRNWNCSGAIALTMGLPDTSSEAADWGTACHQISERCLANRTEASDYIGTTEKGKVHSFEVDEEMAETAQVYVDYVRENSSGDATLQIEQRFSLASLNPPFDAGGTGDAVIYRPKERLLEVVDLKGGRGVVVEAKGNPQLRTYGLGAILANPGIVVDQVKVTIVQPRAAHKDGRIRSEQFHIADLIEWTSDLMLAMRRSADALKNKASMSNGEWSSAFLKGGSHCKFCKAAGFCPALEQAALDAAHVWFDDLQQPQLSNSPELLSPERAAQLLDAADMIEDWITSVRGYWHKQAESGIDIPNYILVDKQGREKWNDDTEKAAIKIAKEVGLPDAKYLNAPKIRTPKQVRTEIAKLESDASLKALEAIKLLSSTPQTGTNLVRADKTTRQAATPKVNQFFDILD